MMISRLLPAYVGRKPIAGPDIADCVGLKTIREKCAHFNAWLTQLETLWR
jgi:hypothetical protein